MQLLLLPSGEIRCVYGEAVDLAAFGQVTIRRASHVEPDAHGQWLVDLGPVQGPLLGPFASRSQALATEAEWLAAHWLLATAADSRLAN